MIDFLHKKSKVCHAYRLRKLLEELVETWLVDEVTIVGVPFCGLKGIRKTTEI